MNGRLFDTPILEVAMPTALERALARFRRRRADDSGDTKCKNMRAAKPGGKWLSQY